MSPFDLLPAPSAPAQTEGVGLQVILNSIRHAAQQKKTWEAHYKALLEALTTHRDLGHVEDSFKDQDWSFRWSPGKTTYEWPANIIELQAQLMEAQEAAVVTRTAIQKPSTPFWTVTPPKPAKPSQVAA